MIIQLRDGQCIDGESQSVRDLYLVDGKIRSALPAGQSIDRSIDLKGKVVMAGAIDIHTHIGGGKVNIARMLLPDLVRRFEDQSFDSYGIRKLSSPVPPVWEIGYRYLQMGYTCCFEPAVLPANARAAHLEMADIPWLDTGGYLLLGNERMLLDWIAQNKPIPFIANYIAWMLKAHQCCGVKIVNAGGIDSFKFNQRHLNVDELHPHFSISPRRILSVLSEAVDYLKLAHPLHVHCSNLGVPGNIASTLATLEAVEGRRIHLTHAQYHCYGKNGPHGFSSEAYQLAEYVNWNRNVTIDIGQVLFGQTVTISGDTMHQYENRQLARPNKVIFQDLECQAGCGVVPFKYRHDQYVHGLQWTIGIELCLRILDASRVFLTTDHPNGGPFTAYPHLIRLLMSYDYRMSIFESLHPDVRATSTLPSLKREYSLMEIAKMTRSGPASILGLHDRGKLEDNSLADIVVYEKRERVDSMFAEPEFVFRRGELVFERGRPVGHSKKETVVASPVSDQSFDTEIEATWKSQYGYSASMSRINPDELCSENRDIIENRSWCAT